ncbi:uncharacterized protein [Temnothorax nylanderi]|uniref:uncharacterized protein n=1 Tax=Temnothorax nylanderi TaxID=102681 RepID=UPI003A840B84
MITRADKGNVTVVLDGSDYLNKMNSMLSDENTYIVLRKDPTRKITKELNNLLQSWLKKEFINHQQYGLLNCTDGVIPRAYGLPKIHKANCPLRMIVSTVNSPLHSLARFLQDLIQVSVPKANSHINNSFELVKKLSGTRIDDHFDLISLDAVSLFTNIPLDLAITSIRHRWQFISQNTKLPLDEFLVAIQFVFDSTYFIFYGVIYKQTFGSPMGSQLSPAITDLVLVDLEIKALERLPIIVPIYFRY